MPGSEPRKVEADGRVDSNDILQVESTWCQQDVKGEEKGVEMTPGFPAPVVLGDPFSQLSSRMRGERLQ